MSKTADLSKLTKEQQAEVLALVNAMQYDPTMNVNNATALLRKHYYSGPTGFVNWSDIYCRNRAANKKYFDSLNKPVE